MKRKRRPIDHSELGWIILKDIEASGAFGRMPPTFVVVPDPHIGWRIEVAVRSRRGVTSERQRVLDAIENKLRGKYRLEFREA